MVNEKAEMRVVALVLCGLGCILLPSSATADSFDDAERSTSTFVDHCQSLRRLDKEELQRLVQAICDADSDERKDVARDAASRAKDKVNYEYEKLEREKDEAFKTVDKVLADEVFKEKHSRAKDFRSKISDQWASIERMTKSVRGANHPVVNWMLEMGRQVHRDRQSNSSYCHEREVSSSSGRADCLYASGSTCYIIELKPKNHRAISKGTGQARRYSDDFSRADSQDLKKLIEKNSQFKECKEFRPRVDCYRLCPEITDDGEFRSVSVDWSTGC